MHTQVPIEACLDRQNLVDRIIRVWVKTQGDEVIFPNMMSYDFYAMRLTEAEFIAALESICEGENPLLARVGLVFYGETRDFSITGEEYLDFLRTGLVRDPVSGELLGSADMLVETCYQPLRTERYGAGSGAA